MSGLFSVGNPPVSLTTVADYASLPASPSPNQACFVTDVGSVYQWDGAAWNLLTTITVADSGDLPSSGVSSGDKALVGGTRIWTKNVGIGWTETPTMATVADYASLPGSPETDDVVFVTDVSSVYQWNGSAWELLTTITVAAVGDLPSTGVSNGDYAAVTTTPGVLYLRSGGAWVRVSPEPVQLETAISTAHWQTLQTYPFVAPELTPPTLEAATSTSAWTTGL